MKHRALFLKVFIFSLILLLIGGCIDTRVHTGPPNSKGIIQEYVHLDPEFSGFESKLVKDSVNEWSSNTHGFISWDFQDWPLYETSSSLLFPFTTNGSNCSKHLLIMRMNSANQTIMDIENSIGYTIAGYANRNSDVCGTETIFLVMDRIHSMEQFRLVVLHEIGHILGLKHNRGSIMDPKGYMAKCITKQDFKNFCDIWDCYPAEFETCQ